MIEEFEKLIKKTINGEKKDVSFKKVIKRKESQSQSIKLQDLSR